MGIPENWGLIGNEWAVELLQNHIAQNRIRHAYLFLGPAGVGRRTLALAFTQSLNCPNSATAGTFCGECTTCKRIQTMQYPDLHPVQAEQVGGVLKVDQIRELQHDLALTPYEGSFRVALLLRFEEAHPSASNALLKTLEEPNPRVVLILTAESTDQLLPTISSRCEILRLRPVGLGNLASVLEERFRIPSSEAQFLAHISNGRPGSAIQLHQNPEYLEKRLEMLNDLWSLLSASRVERFTYAEGLAKDKEFTRTTLLTWILFWRDVMMKSSQAETPVANLDFETKINSLAEHLAVSTPYDMIQQIESTLGLIDRNVNTRLALEVLLLTMPRISTAVLS